MKKSSTHTYIIFALLVVLVHTSCSLSGDRENDCAVFLKGKFYPEFAGWERGNNSITVFSNESFHFLPGVLKCRLQFVDSAGIFYEFTFNELFNTIGSAQRINFNFDKLVCIYSQVYNSGEIGEYTYKSEDEEFLKSTYQDFFNTAYSDVGIYLDVYSIFRGVEYLPDDIEHKGFEHFNTQFIGTRTSKVHPYINYLFINRENLAELKALNFIELGDTIIYRCNSDKYNKKILRDWQDLSEYW